MAHTCSFSFPLRTPLRAAFLTREPGLQCSDGTGREEEVNLWHCHTLLLEAQMHLHFPWKGVHPLSLNSQGQILKVRDRHYCQSQNLVLHEAVHHRHSPPDSPTLYWSPHIIFTVKRNPPGGSYVLTSHTFYPFLESNAKLPLSPETMPMFIPPGLALIHTLI